MLLWRNTELSKFCGNYIGVVLHMVRECSFI